MVNKGFSLLELLAALFLSSILLSLLFSSFFLTNRSIKLAEPLIENDLRLALVATQFSTDIQGVFIPVQAELQPTTTTIKTAAEQQQKVVDKVFYSVNKNNSLEVLSFITNNPLRTYYDEKSGTPVPAVVRVTYRLRADADKTYTLVRYQSSALDFEATVKSTSKGYDLANSIKNISMEYVFEKKVEAKGQGAPAQEAPVEIKKESEWRYDEWVKKDPKTKLPRIPHYIHMRMTLFTPVDNQERSIELMIEIPTFGFLTEDKKTAGPSLAPVAPPAQSPAEPAQTPAVQGVAASPALTAHHALPLQRTPFIQVPLPTLTTTKG